MRSLWALTAVLLAAPILGQFSEGVAYLQLLLSPAALVVSIIALVKGLKPGQRRAFLMLPLLMVAYALSGMVTLGVPFWVKHRAEPLISELEAWGQVHQGYPETADAFSTEIKDRFKASGCHSYTLRPTGFHLLCQGVMFTKCDYDSDTHAWYGWD